MLAAQHTQLQQNLAIVATGGYGRGDLAPGSDIDLLFLHTPKPSRCVQDLIGSLVRSLWDAGLKISQSVRTVKGCMAFAGKDIPALTALFETRLLAGGQTLFADLQAAVKRHITSLPLARFADRLLAQRAAEHSDYHVATVYLLEPNIKKSPGGLRDIHLFRWMATARYETAEPDMLCQRGVLDGRDADALHDAWEFLHRIRNEMHFHANSAQDVLTRQEQLRLTEWLGFYEQGPLLGVERFMQHYYRQTAEVNDAVLRFVDRLRGAGSKPGLIGRLTTYRVGDILVGRDAVRIDPAATDEALTQSDMLLQVFDLARHHGVAVDAATIDRVRSMVPECIVTIDVRRRFLEYLGNPVSLGPFLRDVARVGLLSKLIPPFDRARGLIQFNLYHHYTLDEHSLLAVENAATRLDDRGLLGEAYRSIRRKDLLHLAILLHDLGKGFEEDHCEAGKRLAEDMAGQFGLDSHERHVLVFLVQAHLIMSVTAFRRDLSEFNTVLEFARRVGTPELLCMLYVLTAADIEAVAPGLWTPWKESLLTDLYLRAGEALTGQAPIGHQQQRLSAALRSCAGG